MEFEPSTNHQQLEFCCMKTTWRYAPVVQEYMTKKGFFKFKLAFWHGALQ